MIVEQWGLSREDVDQFSLGSHEGRRRTGFRCLRRPDRRDQGSGWQRRSEGRRNPPGGTLESMAKIKTAFGTTV